MYLTGENFKKLKMSDAKYFSPSMGNIFEDGIKSPFDLNKELIVSNSFLGQVFNRGLYNVLHGEGVVQSKEDSKNLKDIFKLGSAFHCYVLEHAQFDSRYYVSDYIDSDKENIGFQHIKTDDFEFIQECFNRIKKMYPKVIDSKFNEITITGVLDGVPVKAKIDCMVTDGSTIEIIDLKGVFYQFFDQRAKKVLPNGERVGLRRSITALNYDLQGFFYKELVSKAYGIDKSQVSFSLLLCSKDDYSVQMFRFESEQILDSSEQKFKSVWGEVKDFYLNGRGSVKEFIGL